MSTSKPITSLADLTKLTKASLSGGLESQEYFYKASEVEALVAHFEQQLAVYLPAPLPTGWVLTGEHEPEEGIRCEIELNVAAATPLYAKYMVGYEGDPDIWLAETGEWWYPSEIKCFKYLPTTSEKEHADA